MQSDRTEALGRDPIGPLLFRLATPAVMAQLINLLYNLVDRIYIGRIPGVGRLALTGVGVCLPLIILIAAFAALVGMGAAPRASIFLGRGNKREAERVLGNSTGMLLLLSVLLTLVFVLFAEPLLLAFGASPDTLPYALPYMRIYAFGTIFVQLTLGLNGFISAQGFARTSMLTVMLGAVLNVILDPIFIFALDMGVAGAALATIIAQSASMLWIFFFLCGKKTGIRIRLSQLRLESNVILPCLALGLSPFIMQATESLITICFNTSLQHYGGDLAVGAMTVFMSLMQFAILPLAGLTQGSGPIISYNFGAGNPARVRATFRYLLICSLIYSFVLWGALQLFPSIFIRLFNEDPALLTYAIGKLRIFFAVYCVFGAQIACQQTFIALGDAKTSLFLALLRKVILLVPLIYLLPVILPIESSVAVLLAEPVADLIAVSTTVLLFRKRFRQSMQALSQPRADNSEQQDTIGIDKI